MELHGRVCVCDPARSHYQIQKATSHRFIIPLTTPQNIPSIFIFKELEWYFDFKFCFFGRYRAFTAHCFNCCLKTHFHTNPPHLHSQYAKRVCQQVKAPRIQKKELFFVVWNLLLFSCVFSVFSVLLLLCVPLPSSNHHQLYYSLSTPLVVYEEERGAVGRTHIQ